MFHPHEEAARVRMFALLGVRMLAIVLLLRGGLNVAADAIRVGTYQASMPNVWKQTLFNTAIQEAAWLIGAIALLIVQRPLVRWLVPTPPAGCVACGYPRPGSATGPCPECGVSPAPPQMPEKK